MSYTEKLIWFMERERVKRGLTQSEMADALGMTAASYRKVVAGNVKDIKLPLIMALHDLTGAYLFEMLGEESQEADLLRAFRNLTDTQKAFVLDICKFEKEFKGDEDYTEITVIVPVGNLEDGMVWDSANFGTISIPSVYKRRHGADLSCGLRITSNHLHPVYNKGDILLICRRAPRDGDTGIFVNKETGCAYIRRFRQTQPCALEPINGYGETFYVDSENPADMEKWIKFGIVLSKVR